MSSEVHNLGIVLTVEGGKIVAQDLSRVDRNLAGYERTARTAHKTTTNLGGSFRSLRSGIGMGIGFFGLSGLIGALKGISSESIAVQDNSKQLDAALQAVGLRSRAASAQLKDYAEAASVRGAGSTSENIAALTTLVRVTGSATKAQNLFTLATNISRGAHRDLIAATRVVTMVESGRLGQLARMGIIIPKSITSVSDRLDYLRRHFAGATDAYNRSVAGALSNTEHLIQNVGLGIAYWIGPAISKAAGAVTDFVNGIRAGTGMGGKFRREVQGIARDLQPLAKFLWSNRVILLEVAGVMWAGTKAFAAFRMADSLARAALSHPYTFGIFAVVSVLVVAYNKVKWFRDGVNAIFGELRHTMGSDVGAIAAIIGGLFVVSRYLGPAQLLGTRLAGGVIGGMTSGLAGAGAAGALSGALSTLIAAVIAAVIADQAIKNGPGARGATQTGAITSQNRNPLGTRLNPDTPSPWERGVGVAKDVWGWMQHPHFAAGGVMRSSGWALVGERGPELVRLPGGSSVTGANATADVLGGVLVADVPIVLQVDGVALARVLGRVGLQRRAIR